MKKVLIALGVFLIAFLVIFFTLDYKSVDDYSLTNLEEISSDSETVTLSVSCETIFDNYDKLEDSLKESDVIPEDGVILPKTEYVLNDGDTVFDVLNRALKHNKIHFDYSGNPNSNMQPIYIKGISNIYEFDCGDLSGWMVSVNGEYLQMSCSNIVLKNGDNIECRYTCDLGKDVGDTYFTSTPPN